MKRRIFAAIGSVILGVFAFGGYLAWAIADFYLIADQVHFSLVLATSSILILFALFWMFFAIVGHRAVPVRANRVLLWLSLLLGIPGCTFVSSFFLP